MKLLQLRNFSVKLLLLSLMHFATDGLCAYLIISKLYPESPELSLIVFLGYNTLAFVTQSPVGILIDKYNKPNLMLLVSAVSLSLGYLFGGVCLLSVFFLGMGNSLFHVAGGKYVTDKSGNDISSLGIFVSTGAVGLVLGQRYFSALPLPYIFFGIIFICTALMLLSEVTPTKEYYEEYNGDANLTKIALLATIGVVFIRSFVGKVVTFSFEPTEHIFLIIAIATSLGKAMGGILSKLFGINATTAASMSIAAVCLTIGVGNPYIFVLGVFAFNFSMPITLYYANIILKGKEGFAFGTLAAFLAPAYFIALYFTYSPIMRVCTAALCLVSILVIYMVSRRMNNAQGSTVLNDNA